MATPNAKSDQDAPLTSINLHPGRSLGEVAEQRYSYQLLYEWSAASQDPSIPQRYLELFMALSATIEK